MASAVAVEFGDGIRSPDPDEREAALVEAVLQVAEKAAWGFGLVPCAVMASVAYAAVDRMLDHGHLACASGASDEIAVAVAMAQRQHGRPTDA